MVNNIDKLVGVGCPPELATYINSLYGVNLLRPDGQFAFTVDSAGDLNQNATYGGSIEITKNSTAVGQPAATGTSAAGSTISDATQLVKVATNVTTVTAGQGVKLWDAPLGACLSVRNEASSTLPLNVYPPTASISINSRSNGTPYVLGFGENGHFIKVSSVLWIALVGINQEVSNSVSAAGTTISDATDLGAPINNVTTVAAGAGVQLYEAAIGTNIIVRNGGNAYLNVYPPTASGTFNGGSAGAAFVVNSNCVAVFSKLTSTVWIAFAGVSPGFESGITSAGTVIGDAYQLSRLVNVVSTGAAASGVKLFFAPVGQPIVVRNSTSNTIKVWPPDGSGNINGVGAGSSVDLANTELGIFYRVTSATWVGGVAVAF